MQSRVRGEESPTLIHSSRGSGCACVCRPCISSAHPMAIVIAMPEVRNARLFILLSRFGYLIQMLQSKVAGRKGRVTKDPTVAPAPSELAAVHIIAGQISESPDAHHGTARGAGEAKAGSQDDLRNAKPRRRTDYISMATDWDLNAASRTATQEMVDFPRGRDEADARAEAYQPVCFAGHVASQL